MTRLESSGEGVRCTEKLTGHSERLADKEHEKRDGDKSVSHLETRKLNKNLRFEVKKLVRTRELQLDSEMWRRE